MVTPTLTLLRQRVIETKQNILTGDGVDVVGKVESCSALMS